MWNEASKYFGQHVINKYFCYWTIQCILLAVFSQVIKDTERYDALFKMLISSLGTKLISEDKRYSLRSLTISLMYGQTYLGMKNAYSEILKQYPKRWSNVTWKLKWMNGKPNKTSMARWLSINFICRHVCRIKFLNPFLNIYIYIYRPPRKMMSYPINQLG